MGPYHMKVYLMSCVKINEKYDISRVCLLDSKGDSRASLKTKYTKVNHIPN